MDLLIATRNPHKLAEIRRILCVPGLHLLSVDDVGGLPEVEEDGDTFEANARKKAGALWEASGLWTLADDSGLEVTALGGEPGVFSARYAGEPADYAANNRKLLERLQGARDRSARFRCAIALTSRAGQCRVVEGQCRGRIIDKCRGAQGFGYDPLFVPDGYSCTFAEMEGDLKNRISHRALALQAAQGAWAGWLAGEVEAEPRGSGA